LHWLHGSLPGVPVILITAFGDRLVHKRASELGAALVIDKPFSLPELHERVREVLHPTAEHLQTVTGSPGKSQGSPC
jgi:DNA-binding response OmpR family regulator